MRNRMAGLFTVAALAFFGSLAFAQAPFPPVTIEGVKMTLIHVAPAHTSGDLAVYFPDYKVVASGDLIGDGDPTLHLEKNGSSEGWIRFVSALADLDADMYVRGHAGVGTRAQ